MDEASKTLRTESQTVGKRGEVMMTVREEQTLCKLHEFIDANDINCAEDVTQRDSISEQCVDLVAELVDTLCYK